MGFRPLRPTAFLFATLLATARAQTVTPPAITIPPPSPVCARGSETDPACITLPPGSVSTQVDVFFLFDDTGSFSGFVPTVSTIFSGLVSQLESALPGVSLGFGVGRFEDYGGPGNDFSGEFTSGRPFILNQPIITAPDAGGPGPRDMLISDALARTPGLGGDTPESALKGARAAARPTPSRCRPMAVSRRRRRR